MKPYCDAPLRSILVSLATVAAVTIGGATPALEPIADPPHDSSPHEGGTVESVGPDSEAKPEWDDGLLEASSGREGGDPVRPAPAKAVERPARQPSANPAPTDELAGSGSEQRDDGYDSLHTVPAELEEVSAQDVPTLPPVSARPPPEDPAQVFIQEFLDAGKEIAGRPGGEDPVSLTGGGSGEANWFNALVVTSPSNPLLQEQCKKNAVQLSLDSLQQAADLDDHRAALEAATRHMHEQIDFAQSHGISYADYLDHVAECKAFCAPLVAQLVQCQVLAVSNNPHGIVLFELDRDDVDPRYAEGILAVVTHHLEANPRTRAVLVGRASRIGDLRYNRRLSARRTLAVRDHLIELGSAPGRIKTMWFGWEPPHIDQWIATEYGLSEIYAAEGPQRINQSVIVVVYESEAPTRVTQR